MEASTAAEPRGYGNFRKPQSPGLGTLGTLGTAVLFGGLVAVILTLMAAGMVPALALLAVGGVLLAGLSSRDRHGQTVIQRAAARAGWARARASGTHVYRSGPLGRVPGGTCRLPGLAAAIAVTEHEDAYARPFALLHHPSRGHYTVAFTAEPDGASLVDQDQVDLWVAHWGTWLRGLGDEPGVVAASVTVETAPDPGTRLRREVAANMAADAPPVARAMLEEVAETYPAGSASIRGVVAVTFSARDRGTSRWRTTEAMARDLRYRIHHLANGLAATGAGAARPMSVQQLAETIRVAYDPDAARVFDAARADGETVHTGWSDVGPAGAQAAWNQYRHDGATSVTWAMSQAPRGEVPSDVLARLLRPHPDVDRKRVTLLYRPLDAATAARVVEADKRNADFRVNASKRPSARAWLDQRSAQAVAAEEARGAGLVDFAMLVTATVTDPERLDAARHAIDHLAPTARITLRPVYGSQDSAFAACLPLGIVPSAHLNVPAEIRRAV